MSSNIEFENDEFRIEAHKHVVHVHSSKHLATHEERERYRNNRKTWQRYFAQILRKLNKKKEN